MKIRIAAKDADHAIEFMRNDLQIKGRILLGWVDVMKTANTGEVRNLYRVRIDASNTVQNNALYVL
jgi:hypothetical protein